MHERAALDGEWQSEIPTEGEWWLSLHPDKRIGLFDDARPLRVVIAADGDVIEEPSRTRLFTSQMTGALWQRRTVPGDPFCPGCANCGRVCGACEDSAPDDTACVSCGRMQHTRKICDGSGKAKKSDYCQGGGG